MGNIFLSSLPVHNIIRQLGWPSGPLHFAAVANDVAPEKVDQILYAYDNPCSPDDLQVIRDPFCRTRDSVIGAPKQITSFLR